MGVSKIIADLLNELGGSAKLTPGMVSPTARWTATRHRQRRHHP